MPANVNQKSFKDTIQSTIELTEVSFTSSDLSEAFDCGGASVVGILPDSDFTGTILTPQWSVDGDTFYSVKNTSGLDLTINVTPEVVTILLPSDLCAFKYVKFLSDETETCNISIVTRRV